MRQSHYGGWERTPGSSWAIPGLSPEGARSNVRPLRSGCPRHLQGVRKAGPGTGGQDHRSQDYGQATAVVSKVKLDPEESAREEACHE